MSRQRAPPPRDHVMSTYNCAAAVASRSIHTFPNSGHRRVRAGLPYTLRDVGAAVLI